MGPKPESISHPVCSSDAVPTPSHPYQEVTSDEEIWEEPIYTPTSPITGSWGAGLLRVGHSAPIYPTYCTSQPSGPALAPPAQPPVLPAAHALAELLPPNASERFRETFLPSGHPPLPGSLMHRPDLATVLDTLGTYGPAAFYAASNLTLEMVAEVSSWEAPLPLRTLLQGCPLTPSFLPCLSFYICLWRIPFS